MKNNINTLINLRNISKIIAILNLKIKKILGLKKENIAEVQRFI